MYTCVLHSSVTLTPRLLITKPPVGMDTAYLPQLPSCPFSWSYRRNSRSHAEDRVSDCSSRVHTSFGVCFRKQQINSLNETQTTDSLLVCCLCIKGSTDSFRRDLGGGGMPSATRLWLVWVCSTILFLFLNNAKGVDGHVPNQKDTKNISTLPSRGHDKS